MNRPMLFVLAILFWFAQPASAASLRIVSAGASVTAIVQALELDAHLVGVDSTSQPLLEDRQLPDIGYPRQVGAEGLLSLRPDVLLASEETGPPAVLAQLRHAGVEVVVLPVTPTLETLFGNIETLGERFDRRVTARTIVQGLELQLAQLPLQPAERPQALFLLSHSAGSLLVAGDGTAGNSLLGLGGMRNPVAGNFSQYRTLSAEAFLGLAPVWLVTTSQGLEMSGGAQGLLRTQPALAATPAGRQGRILGVDGAHMVGGFSPAVVSTLAELRRAANR
ncbi:heme/hemin ABC transporter substrate-binding protein [Pseudomonas sp.]|uniref:heme/hemin ABC transporter substrate-binding protein n=1 Tax=Pseudomonas sp. TaxID=306 RepID=UPI00272CE463|nr:ABC transporter substrate-binding protein [Pseudomonas sp.]